MTRQTVGVGFTKYGAIIIVSFIGILVSSLLFEFNREIDTHRVNHEFELAAKERTQFLHQQIIFDLKTIHTIARLYAASPQVNRQDFYRFTYPFLGEGGVMNVAWLPRVPFSEKKAFEAQLEAPLPLTQTITEYNPTQGFIPATTRADYFPIYFFQTAEGDKTRPLMGLDMAAPTLYQTELTLARDTGEVVVTARHQALDELTPDQDFEALIFHPIYQYGQPVETITDRQRNLAGYIMGTLHFDTMIEAMLAQMPPIGVETYIFDLTTGAEGEFLAYHRSRLAEADRDTWEALLPLRLTDLQQVLHYNSTFQVGQRQWAVAILPTPHFISAHQDWHAAGFFWGGILVTLLLDLYILASVRRYHELKQEMLARERIQQNLQNYQQNLEQMVAERTEQLNAQVKANQDLLTSQQAILDTVPVGIAAIVNFQLVWGNHRFAEMLGLDLTQLTRFTIYDFQLEPDVYDYFERETAACFQRGEVFVGEVGLKNQRTRADMWCSVQGRLLDLHQANSGSIWVVQDISHRKQMEQKLAAAHDELLAINLTLRSHEAQLLVLTEELRAQIAEKEQAQAEMKQVNLKLRAVLESTQDSIFALDNHYRYTVFNSAGAAGFQFMFGQELKVGVSPLDLLTDEADRANTKAVFDRALAGEHFIVEHPYTSDSLTQGWLEMSYNPIFDGAEVVGLTVFVRDVTTRKQAEVALYDSEERFRVIFESAPEGILLVDAQGQILLVNNRVEYMFGYTPAELVGQSVNVLVPAYARQAHTFLMQDYFAHPFTQPIERGLQVYGQRKDQTTFPTEIGLSILQTKAGQLAVVFVADISARQAMEETLRRNEALLKSVVNNTPTLIYIKDYEGRYMMVNRAFEEFMGLTAAEMLGKTVTDLFPSEVASRVIQMEQTVFLGNISIEQEESTQNLAGEQRIYLVLKFPLHDAQGQVYAVCSMATDITERKQTEKHLRLLYQMSHGANLAPDEQGVLVALTENFMEEGFVATLVYFELDEQHQPISAIIGPSTMQVPNPLYPTGTSFPLSEYPFTQIWFDHPHEPLLVENTFESDLFDPATFATVKQLNIQRMVNLPIHLDGRWVGMLVYWWNRARPFSAEELLLYPTIMSLAAPALNNRRLLKDLQAEVVKRTEAEAQLVQAKNLAEKANRAKSDFLARMSHELRTPLNGILGYAQILAQDKYLTPKQISHLEVIHQSGEHLLNLINEILDLSKIEAGRVELVLAGFDLAKLVQEVIDVVRIRAEQKGLQLSLVLLTDLPPAVQGDEKRLRQILLNLLGNAIKFTEHGQVVLKIGLNCGLIRFQLEDTGIGIPTDQLERIFQPFHQVGEVYFQSEGAGLGLAISQRLVGMMGGQIQVKSQLGRGSTFWFELELPKVVIDPTPNIPQQVIKGYCHPNKLPLKVLVIDDKTVNRTMIVDVLRPLGFEVYEAVHGQEGVEQAKAICPQLILMDIVMPVMNGLEATHQIRCDLKLFPPVILAMSASTFEGDYEASLQAGCDDFLAKPVSIPQLLQKIQLLLELEWVYETPIVPRETMNLPSDLIQELLDSTQGGEMKQVRQAIDRLAAAGPQYYPLVEKLKPLVRQYKLREIQYLLSTYA